MLTPEDRERIALAIEAEVSAFLEADVHLGARLAIEAVRNLPDESPWVRVEDRLPEAGVEVLAIDPFGHRHVAEVSNEAAETWLAVVNGWTLYPTHWMPLPESPEPAPCPSTPSA